MELPSRPRGDSLLPSGEMLDIRRRLRTLAPRHDLATVIACAFDHRTRMLPFFYADLRMAPAGVRSIGSALVDSGFPKTRIVLQQWNRRFRPSLMRLDGRAVDLFLISTMSLHTAACKEMLRDVGRLPEADRPLVIVGGSMCVYEPWEAFYTDPDRPGDPAASAAADVAVTGEEYVLLHLLEVLLSGRNGQEPLRRTFQRARDEGALRAIPGLIYPRTGPGGGILELVDTGVQRLLKDLDELPSATAGFGILEPPGRRATLASQPLPAGRVSRHNPIASLVMTFGCRFSCSYCPIPAYNQRHHRCKSGPRLAEEMYRLYSQYGLRYYFGTDDNFFNDRARTMDIVESLAAAQYGPMRLCREIRWGTEVTVHDTLRMRDDLDAVRRAGARALWLGVEDMSGALVRKGQGYDQTGQALRLLRDNGICPMPMMMHHDNQPLLTRGSNAGLLNQVHLLHQAGAASMQVLMLTPSAGSRTYEQTYDSGSVLLSAAGRDVEPCMLDGNFVTASGHRFPWKRQWSLLAAYVYFYNPLHLLAALARRNRLGLKPAFMQALGMWGLLHTLRRTLGWAIRLMRGPIRRHTQVPADVLRLRAPDGGKASH